MTSQPLQQLYPNGSAAPTKPDSEAEGSLELGRVFAALRRRSLLIISVTTAVAAAAGFRALLSPPAYVAQFEILIQPSSAEIEAISAVAGVPNTQNNRSISLADQTRILTSPEVLAPVVEAVRKEQPEVCNFVGLLKRTPEEACYDKIRRSLTIRLTERRNTAEEQSRIFTASYTGATQQQAERIAALMAQTFLDHGLASRQRDIQQGLDFLDSKLPDVREQVNQLQSELQTLRQRNNLITPDAQGEQLNAQIRQFRAEYLAIQVELEEALALFDDLQQQQQQQSQEFVASPVLSGSQRYQALVQELLRLESQIAEASTLFLNNSPDIEALQEQRQNLLNLLAREGLQAQREVVSRIRALETREEALASTLAELNVNVDQLAGVSREFTDIELELNIATTNLNRLLDRRETLQIEAAQRELPWQLVTPPMVAEQRDSLPRNMALGLVLGLLLGVGLALTIDTAKDTLYTPSDLKRLTPLPILGLIPHYELATRTEARQAVQALVGGGSSGSTGSLGNGSTPSRNWQAFQEAFRSLMANIRQIGTENPIRSMVISSAEPQEGKSTVAAYLAQAAAAMGERVLLVDADLRLPYLHDMFGLDNTVGLSNLLTEEFEVHNVIQRSQTEPNLFILTTGTALADPVRMLSSRAIHQLINKIRKNYDLIIFDAPSVHEYADAALIGAETDGMILVSNLGKLKSTQLEQALEKLWVSKISVLGIVAREASPEAVFQL
jgi:polysaccharide biosynthesis transport protein